MEYMIKKLERFEKVALNKSSPVQRELNKNLKNMKKVIILSLGSIRKLELKKLKMNQQKMFIKSIKNIALLTIFKHYQILNFQNRLKESLTLILLIKKLMV